MVNGVRLNLAEIEALDRAIAEALAIVRDADARGWFPQAVIPYSNMKTARDFCLQFTFIGRHGPRNTCQIVMQDELLPCLLSRSGAPQPRIQDIPYSIPEQVEPVHRQANSDPRHDRHPWGQGGEFLGGAEEVAPPGGGRQLDPKP